MEYTLDYRTGKIEPIVKQSEMYVLWLIARNYVMINHSISIIYMS